MAQRSVRRRALGAYAKYHVAPRIPQAASPQSCEQRNRANLPTVEQKATHRAERDRKAGVRVVDLCLQHELRFLTTLTFAEPTADWNAVRDAVIEFIRTTSRLRGAACWLAVLGKDTVPLHGSRVDALHVHLATAAPLNAEIVSHWQHGRTHWGDDTEGETRDAAAVGKYLRKNMRESRLLRPEGNRRFLAARGMKVSNYVDLPCNEAELEEFIEGRCEEAIDVYHRAEWCMDIVTTRRVRGL